MIWVLFPLLFLVFLALGETLSDSAGLALGLTIALAILSVIAGILRGIIILRGEQSNNQDGTSLLERHNNRFYRRVNEDIVRKISRG